MQCQLQQPWRAGGSMQCVHALPLSLLSGALAWLCMCQGPTARWWLVCTGRCMEPASGRRAWRTWCARRWRAHLPGRPLCPFWLPLLGIMAPCLRRWCSSGAQTPVVPLCGDLWHRRDIDLQLRPCSSSSCVAPPSRSSSCKNAWAQVVLPELRKGLSTKAGISDL